RLMPLASLSPNGVTCDLETSSGVSRRSCSESLDWRFEMLSRRLGVFVLVAALIVVGLARPVHALNVEVRVASGTVAPADTASTCANFSDTTPAPFSVQLLATTAQSCAGFDITALIGAQDNGSTKSLTATGLTIDNNG